MSKWRAIKTGPKDGRKVLLWVGNAYGFDHVKVGLWDDRCGGWSSVFDDGEALGHRREDYGVLYWMPLPKQPRLIEAA